MKKAILFGSIGTLAETSHLQRHAFNGAFAEAGLDWHWDEHTYHGLLKRSGGKQRIEAYAQSVGMNVDAAQLHARKSALFQEALSNTELPLRPGVQSMLVEAQARSIPVALATCTSRSNIGGILQATGLSEDTYACIIDRSMIHDAKPAPDAFTKALELLELNASDAVAIEDNPDGARAALDAGLACIVTAGTAHEGSRFPPEANITSFLTFERLTVA